MDQRPTRVVRPSGARITGWIATLFCAFLAGSNAALATEIGYRVFFLACGSMLVLAVISMIARWYRDARAAGREMDPPA
ncbi:hypothetical protein [Microbacterium paraoxydans]|uniref:Major facilitator superfamily (MFS) profile domain-containing protein n=1 Tax=Microbacterium paraoxydans TaxID=199592 RepID=A0ABS5IR70_9MICO|nr:hypothetical protein [Microbacterium paraoxydans]MBS0025460.1 hypothetical protein [Microbacterium paraoxydans]